MAREPHSQVGDENRMIPLVSFNPYKPSKAHKVWWVRGCDHRGTPRHIRAGRNKAAAKIFAANLTRLCEIRGAGGEIPDELAAWANSLLDPERRDKLVAWGVLPAERLLAGLPLADHLTAWESHMLTVGRLPKHAGQHRTMAALLLEGLGVFAEITPDGVQAILKAKSDERKWSLSTKRAHLVAAKSFCRWMVTMGRAQKNPLNVLALPLVRPADWKRNPRDMKIEELAALIRVTSKKNGVKSRWKGAERALFYRLAAETGMRASALVDLRAKHFHLNEHIPYVEPPAGGRKRRVPVSLRGTLVGLLREHLKGKGAEDRAFKAPTVSWLTDILEKDCTAAGIPRYTFHELRHTFITGLANAGLHPKTIQEAAGHAQLTTTMRYTHSYFADRAAALASVPTIDDAGKPKPRATLRATAG